MENYETEKHADNTIKNNNKIKKIAESIKRENNKLEKLNEIKDLAESINANLNNCLSLISSSVTGSNVDTIITNISDNNNKFIRETTRSIEDETTLINKKINDLNRIKSKIK